MAEEKNIATLVPSSFRLYQLPMSIGIPTLGVVMKHTKTCRIPHRGKVLLLPSLEGNVTLSFNLKNRIRREYGMQRTNKAAIIVYNAMQNLILSESFENDA